MQKVKFQVQVSLDGYIAGPNGEMDWLVWNWDEDIKQYVNDLTETVDCMLLGRKMTDGFINHWAAASADPANPQNAFAKKMIDTPKVVFSKTLKSSSWINTELAGGELSEEIDRLMKRPGKDIVVYGGAGFAASMIGADLIDEYHFFVNPVMVGQGMTIYDKIRHKINLRLVKASPFTCGITVLHYVRDRK